MRIISRMRWNLHRRLRPLLPAQSDTSRFIGAAQACSVLIVVIGVIAFTSGNKVAYERKLARDFTLIEMMQAALELLATESSKAETRYATLSAVDSTLDNYIHIYGHGCANRQNPDICDDIATTFLVPLDYPILRSFFVSPARLVTRPTLLCSMLVFQGREGYTITLDGKPDFRYAISIDHPTGVVRATMARNRIESRPDLNSTVSIDASRAYLVMFGNGCLREKPFGIPRSFITIKSGEGPFTWYFSTADNGVMDRVLGDRPPGLPPPSNFDMSAFFGDSPAKLGEYLTRLSGPVPNSFFSAELLNIAIIEYAFRKTGIKMHYKDTDKALLQIASASPAGFIALPLINATVATADFAIGLLSILFVLDAYFYYLSRRCDAGASRQPCILVDPIGIEKILAAIYIFVLLCAHILCLWVEYIFANARLPSYRDIASFELIRSLGLPSVVSWAAVLGSAFWICGFVLFVLGMCRLIINWPKSIGKLTNTARKRPRVEVGGWRRRRRPK